MDSTTDAEQELLKSERLCAVALEALERQRHEYDVARERVATADATYSNAVTKRDHARRALQDAYQNKVSE